MNAGPRIIKSALQEIGEEELIPEADSLFMMTYGGYIKRMPPDVLRAQKRGGKGLVGMATKEEDAVSQFFVANTHDQLMFFTNSGKIFQTKGYEVPESARQAKGKAIVNFLQVSPQDRITAIVPISKEDRKNRLSGNGNGQRHNQKGQHIGIFTGPSQRYDCDKTQKRGRIKVGECQLGL